MRWSVEIVGSTDDLAAIAVLFPRGGVPGVTIEDDMTYWLRWDTADHLDQLGDVLDDAVLAIKAITGIARTRSVDYCNVRLSTRFRDLESGVSQHILRVGTAVTRSTFGSITVGGTKAQEASLDPKAMYDIARGNANVSEALGYLTHDAETNWVDLYKVFEIVRDDFRNERELRATLGISKSRLSSFTLSAQHPMASGKGARHARISAEPPNDPMTLQSARRFVAELVDCWIRFLSTRTPAP